MPTVDSARLQSLDDIRSMLLAAILRRVLHGRLLHPVRKIRLEPVASFLTHPQITTCLPVDPSTQIDPLSDLLWTLPVPRHILAQVSIRLCTVVSKASEHIDADFLGHLEFRMIFEGL
ncbi:hypothetical protein D3C85_1083450 [compost metagenome]